MTAAPMITADTLTDEQIAGRLKLALARCERGTGTPNDREFIRIYRLAMLPIATAKLNAEARQAVDETRARLAEIINGR